MKLSIFLKRLYFSLPLCLLLQSLAGQSFPSDFIYQAEIRIDTLVFSLARNHVVDETGNKSLIFVYDKEDEVASVSFMLKEPEKDLSIILQPSGDFDILDSVYRSGHHYKFKVRFKDLTRSGFLKFIFHFRDMNEIVNTAELNLFPCTKTQVWIYPSSDELFIGEEKTFDLVTSNPENIRFSNEWTSGHSIDYRLENQNNQIRLFLIANDLGMQQLRLPLALRKPWYDAATNRVSYDLPPLTYVFNVKTSRLRFLSIDKREITLDESSRRQGIEIMLDQAKLLEMNKTYRLEDQENTGGTLIAEIVTRNALANNRVLCYLRAYNYHRTSDGYLYIKDGDDPMFITNFNITPKTSISKLSILREGKDWVQDASVYPGETVEVRIEGEALHKARFYFEDLLDITTDTLIRSESEAIFKLKVPVDISKKRLGIYNYSSHTGIYLNVREFEEPRPFDFIYINYGDINRPVTGIRGPILYNKGIRDVVLSFNTEKLDEDIKLFGPQYLQIDFRVTGPKNELVDMRTLDNIVICPSGRSPRYAFYDKRNCTSEEISLNKYIRRNTSDLEDWSRISVTLRHSPTKYGGEGQQKEVEIVLKKSYKLDIDVSFPAGLITVSRDSENQEDLTYSNLYGISMAMVAQMSFYHPDKIAKLRPFRIGAGFLALDAFNFQSEKQDLALVFLASIYPSSRDRKLTFPLYLGGGFQFKAEKWMLLMGPGISIRL
jgi:hypothetical protein